MILVRTRTGVICSPVDRQNRFSISLSIDKRHSIKVLRFSTPQRNDSDKGSYDPEPISNCFSQRYFIFSFHTLVYYSTLEISTVYS